MMVCLLLRRFTGFCCGVEVGGGGGVELECDCIPVT